MKKIKRILTALLTAAIVVTSIPIEGMAAQQQPVTDIGISDVQENSENENEKEVPAENTESMENIDNEENTPAEEASADGILENVPEEEDSSIEEITVDEEKTEESYLLEYLMVNQPNVSLGEKQQIVLGIGCDQVIEEAVLNYSKQNSSETFQKSSNEVIDGALLFEIPFEDASQTGVYQLDSVTFKAAGNTYVEYFADAGIEAVFGMDQEIEMNPDAVIDDGMAEELEAEMEIVRIDENGDTVSEISLEEAIENANEEQPALLGLRRAREIVVVLDPGHDNTHAGAQANGLSEEDLNIKIAKYCKEELESYQGVTVYLTRGLDGECPYPGTTSGKCNEKRVAFAKNVGADIYVSLHNNSSTSTSAHGAMVFYPNKNYNPEVSEQGKELAQQIQDQLVKLGLYDRGITIKYSADYKYPDGSTADYYAVIRNSKLAGIPAIIVEHAFVSNAGDVNDFLKNNEKLKKLGVTDATAIASYYGLAKEVHVTAGPVTVSNLDHDQGSASMKALNVAPSDKISKVSFAVWSSPDQNDLYWYPVKNNGTGNYEAVLDISNHKYHYGNYYVDAYAYDIYGRSHYIGGTTCTFTKPKQEITVSGDALQKTYRITAVTGRSKSVSVAVWSQKKGQDDLIWYHAKKTGSGAYVVDVPIANHRTAGLYYADVYVTKTNDKKECIGGVRFQVTVPSAGSMEITNQNDHAGTFDVVFTDVQSVSGVSKLQVPVWSKSDHSDLYWYTAKKQSDGSYVAKVSLSNHQYNYGKFYVDSYLTAGNGVYQYLGGKTVVMNIPKTEIRVNSNQLQTSYTLTADDVWPKDSVKKLQFAVWSQTKGQDDLVWYQASKNADQEYLITVPISKHKTAGKYYADAYITGENGKRVFVGATTFEVTAPTIEKLEIENKDECKGTFDVVLTGIQSVSGVSELKVPVWSKANQSDLHWYVVQKQSDGSYVAKVSLSNHQYNYGKYYVDTYLWTVNGIKQYVGGTTVTMNALKSEIKAAGNTSQTEYVLTATNVWPEGSIKKLQFAVWSQKKGQDDLHWYTAKKDTTGSYTVTVPISNHKTGGKYYVDAYVVNLNGKRSYSGGTTFNVTEPSAEKVEVVNKDDGTGTFDVMIDGVQSVSGVNELKVPVWSKSDQSDLYWYVAQKQSDGSYLVNVNLKNHQYNYGKYYVDTYLWAVNGIKQYLGGEIVTMNPPKAKITAKENTAQTEYELIAENVGLQSGVKSLQFAVWSQKNGQDDLKWYTAKNVSAGKWTANMLISNHRTAGKYYVDTYAVNMLGQKKYVGGTTFQVEAPSVSAVTLVDFYETLGTFGVEILDAKAASGIESIKVAVWSAANQSDLVWYTASKNSQGNYRIDADIKNHQNNRGKYYADAYLTTKNGIKIYAGGVNCSIQNVTKNIGKISSCEIVSGSRTNMTLRFGLDLENSVEKQKEYYVVETDLSGSVKELLRQKGESGTVSLEVQISGKDGVNAALMDKFALAVKDANGNLKIASEATVISNPEAIAHNTETIFKGTSKKGLQGIAYASYENGTDVTDARNANTKQTFLNLDLATVVSTYPKAGFTAYSYKGNTYYFSELSGLKKSIQSFNEGYKQYLYGNSDTTQVAVTLGLLLSYNSENSFLIDPAARTPGHAYYMLNVREERARETLEALFLYLGETFGASHCYVSNWVLGNEINSSRTWNYSGSLDFDTYMECYATAFRMLYNGVKSEKTGNTVCISLDNGWTAVPDTYAGKVTLDTFARKIYAQNPRINWSISCHAYSYPLTRADFWNDYSNTTDSLSTPYISMRNISVLTDYAGALENNYGKTRGSIRVLLTEQGYSYGAGAEQQAMAIARGYYMAEFNDRIDAFIIRAIVDDAAEMSGNLYFGLMNAQQEKRISFYTYEYMDSDLNQLKNTSASGVVSPVNYGKFNSAKNILCNTNWKSVIPGFNASKLTGIK